MENKDDKLTEASWELFMETGDPFYFVAKNTFTTSLQEETYLNKIKAKKIQKEEENGLTNQ